jgi:hypothetical protein
LQAQAGGGGDQAAAGGGQVDGVGLGQAGVARFVIGAGENLCRAGGVQQQEAGMDQQPDGDGCHVADIQS